MENVKLNDLLFKADSLKNKLNNCRDWDQKTVQEALNIEYTYDSNRIEGNTRLSKHDIKFLNTYSIQ